jgi:RNA polymerase sigma-B factor
VGTVVHADDVDRERLIEQYLPLVHALARRYARRDEPLEDLVQAGSIGLINAVDRFERERGCALEAYAVPSIVGEIRHHLRDRAATVRLPRRVQAERFALRRADRDLRARLGRVPTFRELADEAGLPSAEAAAALLAGAAPTSIDEEAPLVAEAAEDAVTQRLALLSAARSLHPRQRRILHLRFFCDRSQAAIAQELGLSPVHVSRLLRDALERMRGSLDADGCVVDVDPGP